jgi:hypothetical protein
MDARYSLAVLVTVTFLGASLVGSTVRAGVGRHDRPEERYLEMAEQFPAVGSVVGLFTGTLIAPEWVLTCAHGAEVLDRIVPTESLRTVRFAGNDYRIVEVVLHPGREGHAGRKLDVVQKEHGDQHDIALLRLDRPVTNVKPLGLNKSESEVDAECVLATCGGWIPDGRVGLSQEKALDAKRGELHAGTNRIDLIDESGLLVVSFTSPDRGATDLEVGGSGAGDSGAPVLIQDDGHWKVAGILSVARFHSEGTVGHYGDQYYCTRVSKDVDWIRSTTGANRETLSQTKKND